MRVLRGTIVAGMQFLRGRQGKSGERGAYPKGRMRDWPKLSER